MVIGVIPARGGSKRVPRKILRDLAGVPLIEWTIAAARAAMTLDHVLVTSDDPEILDLARHSDCSAIARPAALAADDTPDLPVAQHVLDVWPCRPWTEDDIMVWLRPTSPFRTAADIDAVVAHLRAYAEVSSVRSVTRAREHPEKLYREAGWGIRYTALVPYSPHHAANGPSQALPTVWQPVGYVDAVRVPWIRRGSMEGPVIAAWVAPLARMLEIDEPHHFEVAETIIQVYGYRPEGA